MSAITTAQKEIISGYHCERLTGNPENRELIKAFENKRNPHLARVLTEHAWDDDAEGNIAYYVVKDADGDVALYFSLKCGVLFDPLDEETLQNRARLADTLKRARAQKPNDEEWKAFMADIIEEARERMGVPDEMLMDAFLESINAHSALNDLAEDRKREDNENIMRVTSTYSGIELVHFCANDRTRHKWDAVTMNHSCGQALFWQFVVPIVLEIRDMVGCQYLFLFAADLSADRTLVRYYETLRFERPQQLGIVKPRYDFLCIGLAQEIQHLEELRQKFLDNFNS